MKKSKYFLLTLALLLLPILILSSCANNPHEYDWYVDYYVKDNVTHHKMNPIDRLDHFSVCTGDTVKIKFNNDGKFTFNDYAGVEHKGTFTSNKKRGSVAYQINLSFENGETAVADCISPTGSDALLKVTISGVEYAFIDYEDVKYLSTDFATDIKNLATGVRDASRSESKMVEQNGVYYYKGSVTEKDGKFYLTYADIEYDLSRRTVYKYYIDEKDTLSKKDTITAGECIVREKSGEYAIYYYSPNESYVRESVTFSEIYDWAKELTIYDISEIAYVYDRGSLAPGHLQEARIATFAECEAIMNYLDNAKLDYVAPENVTAKAEGESTDFIIITTDDGEVHKFYLERYHYSDGNAYKTEAVFPTLADHGTNYVNIDTHLIHREIFKYGNKIANTDVDLSYVILESVDNIDGIDLDFTTDCTYVSDVTVNIIDARHVQYDGVLYKVISEYNFSDCISDIETESYSILTIKNSLDGSVILTVKYDTGKVLNAEEILGTALKGTEYSAANLYLDETLSNELTSLTLSSNTVIFVK